MKKVININFQGRVVPIEENAYEILKHYVDSLRQHFAKEEGKEEIINDIESRIAELFAETLKKGSTCITDEDVENIIKSMGRPEDFDDDEGRVHSQLGGEKEKGNTGYQQSFSNTSRRLYRDENNKVLGGICSGIANYFGIDPLVIRILAVITFGFSFFPYLVLWIAIPSSATQVIGSPRKRLFRDMDDKFIGGVCSGLGHYFGVKVWIPRVLFLIPFLSFVTHFHHWNVDGFPNFISLSFSPGATVLYIILWMILPEAITSADKLEMKGERVDLNSIKNTIQTDMEGFRGRAEKFGSDLKDKAQEFGPRAEKFGNEAASVANRTSRGLGGVIVLLVKIFAYFILAVVSFAIVAALFALGVAFFGVTPLLDYVLDNSWESVLAWLSVILLVWMPIIGIITWFVRKITNAKRKSHLLRITSIALTIIGFTCLVFLLASLGRDFKYKSNRTEEKVLLTNPKVNKLEVQLSGYGGRNGRGFHWLKIEPFEGIDTDTVFVPNTDVRIVKSSSDSFEVTVLKISNGSSKQVANGLADKINCSITQKDSILSLYKGIPINTTDKFRNQRVIITIAVPLGKRIKVDDKIGWRTHLVFGFQEDDFNWKNDYMTDDDMDWQTNKEYIMTEKGLKEIRGSKVIIHGSMNGATIDGTIDDNDDNDESIEEKKQNLEELRHDIEEKQHEMDEKKRELQRQLDEEQRKLDEKKRELKLDVDTSGAKAKIQKIVAAPKKEKTQLKNMDNELTPSFINTI